MPTIKQLETALVNADRAGDEEAARALAAEIRRMRAQGAQVPKAKPKGEAPGRAAAFAKGALSGAADVILAPVEYAFKGLSALGVPGTAGIVRRGEQDVARTQVALAPYRQARPNAFAAGKLIGETAASAPLITAGGAGIARLGGAVATKAPAAGRVIQRVGRAVQTGGIGAGRTPAQTAALSRGARVGQLAERMAGGAIAGGAGAALTGQDVQTGATFGAGLPVVASVLKRVGGFAGDITKLPRQKAAEIIRKALGDKADEARAVFAQLSPDDKRLAEQVLIEAGVEPDPFFGIGKVVQEQTVAGATPMREALEAQAKAREQRLAQAAGGATMEEIREAARGGRKAVTEEMAPVREEMYRRAGYANEFVTEKMAEATQLENLAADQSAQARRFTLGAINREDFLGQMDDLGDAFNAAEINQQAFRPRAELVKLEQRGEKAAKTAINARERARDIYDEVDALAAEGIEPLRAADLIAPLRAKLADPTIAVDTLESNTIRGVIRKLEAATDKNGMLNPRALGKIMRSGIGDLVEIWSKKVSSGAAPSSGTIQRGQSLGLEMRDMIKDTLRKGGAGDLVDEFFNRSEQGYAAVNRGELAGEAFRLYKQDPQKAEEFLALMSGERPKVVGKIMGGGPEGEILANAFAQDPARFAALQQSAREMETLNRMADLRLSGAGPAGKIMVTATPTRMSRGLATLAGIPYTPLGFAARGGEQVERAFMAPRVERELAGAYLSGPAMGELLNTFPMKSRISQGVSNLSPMARNIMAQLLRGYSAAPAETNYPE